MGENPGSSPNNPWWESKLALLLIGFLLTSLLAPWLQFVQKRLERTRQVYLDSDNRKLAALQSAREELTEAYVATEAIAERFDERQNETKQGNSLASKSVNAREQSDDVDRGARIREIAKLSIIVDQLPDPERVRVPLEEALAAWKAMANCEEALGRSTTRRSRADLLKPFEQAKEQFRANYELVKRHIEEEVGEVADANGRLF